MKKKLTAATATLAVAGALAAPVTANAQTHDPAPLHGISTGSSALDVSLVAVVVGGVVKLIVDNVEPLAVAVEEFAGEIGSSHLVGSSGISFNLEELSS